MIALKHPLIIAFTLWCGVALCQVAKSDTAVVRSYGGIQVFYNCKPLHPYWVLGKSEGKATVNKTSQAFARYASEAQWNYPGCTGIIIDDLHFDNDHYQVIRTLQPSGYHDTAVISAPIFMSSTPVREYEIVNTMHLRPGLGSLQSNLDDLYTRAKGLVASYDGIIVNDMDFGFGKSDILIFKWKGP